MRSATSTRNLHVAMGMDTSAFPGQGRGSLVVFIFLMCCTVFCRTMVGDDRWSLVIRSLDANRSLSNARLTAEQQDALSSLAKEVGERIAGNASGWSEAEAANLYRDCCRLYWMGDRSLPAVARLFAAQPMVFKPSIQPRALRGHPVVGWPAGSYSIVTTPHFAVVSQASSRLAVEVARVSEQTYAVWQQVFFSSWSNAGSLRQSLQEGKPLEEIEHAPFQIVLFRNRESYLHQLQQIEPKIAVSTGYYSPERKTVFCYWDDVTSLPTLRHELTHQFFSEAVQPSDGSAMGMKSDFWIVEGLALYMESMRTADRKDSANGFEQVFLGGWDAPRLQPARYRRLHDQTWIPWDDFRRADRERFQANPDLKIWYSQAAGLTHRWMDALGEEREKFLAYIRSVYRDEAQPELLAPHHDEDSLRRSYDRFLREIPITAGRAPDSTVRELVLSRTEVTSEMLLSWPRFPVDLEWLDLSFSRVDDRLFAAPSKGKELFGVSTLRRLNLEETAITDASLASIATLRRLEELDLSRCSVSDDGVQKLGLHPSLRILWLSGNRGVTDLSLDALATCPRLETLHVDGTSITAEGWRTLISRKPRLNKK